MVRYLFLALFFFGLHRKHLHSFNSITPFGALFIFNCCADYIPLPRAFTSSILPKMIASFSLLLTSVALSFASPLDKRVVTSLNQAAFEEAQQRDDTATRAFSGTEIKVRIRDSVSEGPMLTIIRLPMENVYSSTNFQGTFGQI